MIKFSAARLEREPVELSGNEPPEFLALPEGDEFSVESPMSYDLIVRKVSGGALVSGSCEVTLSGTCGRCLEHTAFTVSADDIELFFDLDEYGEEIDISDDIREELLLNLPMNILCQEDCAGLCHNCGSNLNKKKCKCSQGTSGSLAWSALDDLKL
jgi:uncharacterized protein